MSHLKRVFKQDVCLRSLILIKQAWYVVLVMEDLYCLPAEYQLILEQNVGFSMFFMLLMHPIALLKKENIANLYMLR